MGEDELAVSTELVGGVGRVWYNFLVGYILEIEVS